MRFNDITPYPLRALVVAGTASVVLFIAMHAAAEGPPRPSFHALPDRTVFVAQLPDPSGLRETMEQHTRLGKLLFGVEQQARVSDVVAAYLDGAAAEEGEAQALRRYGLSAEDWLALLNGPAGVAICLVDGADEPAGDWPRMMCLAWSEAGDDLAGRLVNAVGRFIEERTVRDGSTALTRVDLDLAGHAVMRITEPVMGQSERLDTMRTPPGMDELSRGEREALIERMRQAYANRPVQEINRRYTFITQMGPRVILGYAPAQGGDLFAMAARRGEDPDAPDMDLDVLAGMDAATAQFARFLAAHEDAADGAFAARMLAVEGLGAALPSEGQVCIEAFADPQPILKALGQSDIGLALQRWFGGFGLDQIGPMAWRTVLDGNILRSGSLLSLPAPRGGLFAYIDQPVMASQLPAWVPTGVMQYAHVSFDLGAAYELLKTMAIASIGREIVDEMETNLADSLGPDPAATLSSLGWQHHFVRYPSRPASTDGPRIAEAHRTAADGAASPTVLRRWAWVWQPTDAAAGQRLLQPMVSRLVDDQAVARRTEEQGFTGWRAQADPLTASLFAGKGFLTLCFGPDVTTRQLNALAQPPVDEAALLNGPLMEQVRQSMTVDPAIGFLVVDTATMLRQWLAEDDIQGPGRAVASIQGSGPSRSALAASDGEAMTKVLRRLLPPAEESAQSTGVFAGVLDATDSGLSSHSALWLTPSADE